MNKNVAFIETSVTDAPSVIHGPHWGIVDFILVFLSVTVSLWLIYNSSLYTTLRFQFCLKRVIKRDLEDLASKSID